MKPLISPKDPRFPKKTPLPPRRGFRFFVPWTERRSRTLGCQIVEYDVTPLTLKFFTTQRLADVQRLIQNRAQDLARLNRVPMTRCRHPTTRYGLRYFTGTSG